MEQWQIIANILVLQECLNRAEPPYSASALYNMSLEEVHGIYNQLFNDWYLLKKRIDSLTGELY